MTPEEYVKGIYVFAEGNPNPEVSDFFLSPKNGRAEVSTRIRLAQTQKVVVVAEMSDGSLWTTRKKIKVTIGGCGG
jgi:sulfur-oxidizing protein SoxY